MSVLQTPEKIRFRYEPGKVRAPRPGEFVIGADGRASEIQRIFGRVELGWRLLDASGRAHTARAGERRGEWISLLEPKPPIQPACGGS